MDMEDQSILMGLLNDQTKQMLIDSLSIEKQNEFFFYQNFNIKEKTDVDTKKFVANLVEDYYDLNN